MEDRGTGRREPVSPEPRAELVSRLLLPVALAAAACGLVALVLNARLFAGRLTFPLDLEWMEGGMLVHAQRIAQGQGIYVAPSMDFIPYLYTPLYPALLAILSFVFPLGYTLGRLVSLFALTGACCLLVVGARGETGEAKDKRLGWLVGIAGAGAVVAAFGFTGSFYDLVRADSLLLGLEALALWLAVRAAGWGSAAVAGVTVGFAFFTKQTASIVGLGIGIGLFVANWRRGLGYAVAAAVVLGAGLSFLIATSDGWFWTYIFKLHQGHPFSWDGAFKTAPAAIFHHAWPVFSALGLSTVALALKGKLRRTDAILWSAAVAGPVAAMVGFGTKWAFFNAFIPGVFFPCFAAVLLSTRLMEAARSDPGRTVPVVAALAVTLLGWQSLHAQRPEEEKSLPGSQDRAAAAHLLTEIRSLPGPLFIPFHPYYGVLAGKRPFAHRIGLYDIEAAFGRPEWLGQAIGNQRFAAIVLDWRPKLGEWPALDTRYHPFREFIRGQDSVGMFAGVQTSPRLVFLPNADPPPLPPGGRVLFDFENGDYTGFVVTGAAMGGSPAPAPAGTYGRFAVNSAASGPVPEGSLLLSPFAVDRARLRFTLVGPADRSLRVSLRKDGTVLRSASPTGQIQTQEWDLSDLQGASVEIVIDDESPTGGLAVDEFVAY